MEGRLLTLLDLVGVNGNKVDDFIMIILQFSVLLSDCGEMYWQIDGLSATLDCSSHVEVDEDSDSSKITWDKVVFL